MVGWLVNPNPDARILPLLTRSSTLLVTRLPEVNAARWVPWIESPIPLFRLYIPVVVSVLNEMDGADTEPSSTVPVVVLVDVLEMFIFIIQ